MRGKSSRSVLDVLPGGARFNLTQAQTSCTAGYPSQALGSGTLSRLAAELAGEAKIDPLADLERARIYLFSGSADHTVATPVVEAARSFFLAAGVPSANIAFVSLPAGHAFLTSGQGEACEKSESPYLNNCHYDQAGAILGFIYGQLAPKSSAKASSFVSFGQGEFSAPDATLLDKGVAYIPSACQDKEGCAVHIVYHGCNQSQASVGDAFIHGSGFAEWAETNRIIVLFPQAASSLVNPLGCWDWWGYTSGNFLTAGAPQIKSIMAMLSRLGESHQVH